MAALSYFLLFSAFYSVYYEDDFYRVSFQELGVYAELGNETDSLNAAVLHFLNTGEAAPAFERFSDKERSHLSDVKQLLNLFCLFYYVAIAFVALGFFICRKALSRMLFESGILSLALLLLLLVGSLFFNSFFEGFHMVFFPQGNYEFHHSLLTTFYPESFFYSFFAVVLKYAFVYSMIASGLGFLLNKR